MTLTDIETQVAELGPHWKWLVRSCSELEEKPEKFLANLIFEVSGTPPVAFPVFASSPITAFTEAYRRAELFSRYGVR